MQKKYDFLVIGSGIAGMSYALKVAEKGKVALVSKTTLEVTNTSKAQGGIAAVTDYSKDPFNGKVIYTNQEAITYKNEATDAIKGITAISNSDVYNLNGQKVDANAKGIVIKAGKKVLVK